MQAKRCYGVYTKLQRRPHAVFETRFHAEDYIKRQQKIWTNAKFRIERINE